MTNDLDPKMVRGAAGMLAVYDHGDATAPVVVMTHSVLSASFMWESQVRLLASRGFRVVCVDTRGHGASAASPAPYAMGDLVADTVDVLDALKVAKAHYVGLSLGGMSGFGLGIAHADRLASLCLCAARADAPPAVAAPWDERIAIAEAQSSCAPLAQPTIERWFGKAYVESHPAIAERFVRAAAATSVEGFKGCARAIQSLAYLDDVGRISTPTTLIVGANDGVLPQAMSVLHARIPGSVLELVADAGHLPNIDQPEAFDAALLRHFDRVTA
jgi:3-oxoadipate enol-lactonase